MSLIDMSEIFQMTNVGDHIDGTDVYQSNDNLLDNWYFVGGGSQLGDGVFPINQRGLLNYGAGYTIDRWKLSSGGTLVFTNDGISIDGLFFQKKVIDFTVGETYTLSRQTTDGNVVSVTGVVPSTEGWMIGDQTFGVYFRPSTKVCDIQIWGTYLLKAVKLEKGTVSTLANDAPPDFGAELRKCQRYLFVLDIPAYLRLSSVAIASDTTNGAFSVVTPVNMAKSAIAASISGSLTIGGVGPVSSIPWATAFGNNVYVEFVVNGAMVAGTMYPVGASAQVTKLILSAEL